MLIARNKAATLAGLEVPTTSEIMNIKQRDRYFIGENTLCMVHNKFGQYYLSSIVPIHKYGLRRLMTNALAARRL